VPQRLSRDGVGLAPSAECSRPAYGRGSAWSDEGVHEREALSSFGCDRIWQPACLDGDWDVLSVGLFNLLDNAIRFPRRGDKVELMAEEDEGAVV